MLQINNFALNLLELQCFSIFFYLLGLLIKRFVLKDSSATDKDKQRITKVPRWYQSRVTPPVKMSSNQTS